MNEPGKAANTFREEIGIAVADMLYISESEAPVELLPADPELRSQEAIAAAMGGTADSMEADAFLQRIRDSIDPDDDGLQTYRQQWEGLFAMLCAHTADVCVYRSGNHPVTITIAAMIHQEAILIRTAAVET